MCFVEHLLGINETSLLLSIFTTNVVNVSNNHSMGNKKERFCRCGQEANWINFGRIGHVNFVTFPNEGSAFKGPLKTHRSINHFVNFVK